MQIPFEVLKCAGSTATATTASGTALAANVKRRSALFVNNGSGDVFLARGATAELNKGIVLKANGGSYEINATNLYKGIVTCITASGTVSISVEEGV